MTELTEIQKNISAAGGPSYFKYNGELITEIAYRTQWKEFRK